MIKPSNTSYWEATALLPVYDLVIVGAGLAGLSTALFYARKNPDARIVVFERGYLPDGASTKNAGFACYGSVTEIMDDLTREPEDEVKSRITRRYEGLELLKSELGSETIQFSHENGYEIFTDKDVFRQATHDIAKFNEWIYAFSGVEQAFKTVNFNGYDCVVNPMEGSLHSGKLIRALLNKVTAAGVDVRFNTPVTKVDDQQVILADGRTIQTAKTLLATNAFTSDLLPEIGIRPARGYILVTGPLKENPWKGMFHYDKGYVYFRGMENRILLGGGRNQDINTEQTTKREINPIIKNYLVDFANNVLKLETGWQIEYEWTGIMGFGAGKSPVIKQVRPGIFVTAGFAGMGVALAMQAAKETVELIS